MISDIALTEEALSLHPLSKRFSFVVFDAEGYATHSLGASPGEGKISVWDPLFSFVLPPC